MVTKKTITDFEHPAVGFEKRVFISPYNNGM